MTAQTKPQVHKAARRHLDVYLALGDAFGCGALGPEAVRCAVDACAAHLEAVFGLDEDQAADAALVAWAEMQGDHTRVSFDLQASTPHLVFLVDHVAGERRAVSASDLLRVMGPRVIPAPKRAAG